MKITNRKYFAATQDYGTTVLTWGDDGDYDWNHAHLQPDICDAAENIMKEHEGCFQDLGPYTKCLLTESNIKLLSLLLPYVCIEIPTEGFIQAVKGVKNQTIQLGEMLVYINYAKLSNITALPKPKARASDSGVKQKSDAFYAIEPCDKFAFDFGYVQGIGRWGDLKYTPYIPEHSTENTDWVQAMIRRHNKDGSPTWPDEIAQSKADLSLYEKLDRKDDFEASALIGGGCLFNRNNGTIRFVHKDKENQVLALSEDLFLRIVNAGDGRYYVRENQLFYDDDGDIYVSIEHYTVTVRHGDYVLSYYNY